MNYRLGRALLFGLTAILTMGRSAQAWAGRYDFTEISVPNSTSDEALAVNDHDTVVGVLIDQASSQNRGYARLNGVVTVLPESDVTSELYSIDDRGIAVGYLSSSGNQLFSGVYYDVRTNTQGMLRFTYDHKAYNLVPEAINQNRMVVGGSGTKAFLVGPKSVVMLTPPGAGSAITPLCLNNAGMVAGTFNVSSKTTKRFPRVTTKAFTYFNGTYSKILPPGSANTFVDGISNTGVVGGTYIDHNHAVHGYTFDGSVYHTVDFPGAISTSVVAFSSDGRVFGDYEGTNKEVHGFVLIGSQYYSLSFPGSPFTVINSVNAAGTFVGSTTATGDTVLHSFIATCAPHQRPCTR